MKQYRAVLLASTILAAALPLFGCGNALDGGSGPSGSYIRVSGVSPSNFEPDIFLTFCTALAAFEANAVKNTYATVTLLNQSAPNSTTPTSSFVTMNRYRVDFTGVSHNVTIPPINNGGQTVGIEADGSGVMTVLVMDLDTLEYIRSHYPTIGNGESLTLRATITMWGTDSFKVTVSPPPAEITLVIDDYTTCE